MTDRLAAGEVAVYLARPDLGRAQERAARYGSLLTGPERVRIARYCFEEDRDEHLVTRVLVRIALSRHRPQDAASWRFRENDHGRPEIDPPCGLRFNATNSHGLVACAVTEDSEVGIDVEPRSRLEQILEVATAVFSESELEELRALGAVVDRERAFESDPAGPASRPLDPGGTASSGPVTPAGAGAVGPGPLHGDEPEILAPRPTAQRRARRPRVASSAPEPARERALALWTLKEAYIKARGIGLGLPLQRMSITFGPSGSIALATARDVDPEPARWHFQRIDLGSHVLAIAVESLAEGSIVVRPPVTLLDD